MPFLKLLMARIKNRSGITLVETLIVGIAIAFIAVSLMAFFTAVNRHLNTAWDKYKATDFVISQLEELKQIAENDFGDPALNDAPGLNPHGATIAVPAGFALTYSVIDCYDWPEDGTKPATPPDPADTTVDYKKITAVCIYQTDKQVSFTTYIINR
jgi:Flp pilus assembly pilin Flp